MLSKNSVLCRFLCKSWVLITRYGPPVVGGLWGCCRAVVWPCWFLVRDRKKGRREKRSAMCVWLVPAILMFFFVAHGVV